MSTSVGYSKQSEAQWRASRHIDDGGSGSGVLYSLWTVCLDETVRYVAGGQREEEMNKNMKAHLNMFSNHGAEIQTDLVKDSLQEQECLQSLRSVYPLLSRSSFVEGEYTPYLKNYAEEETISRNRPGSRDQAQRVLSSDNYGPSRRIGCSSLLISDDEEIVVPCVAKVLLLFYLNIAAYSNEI